MNNLFPQNTIDTMKWTELCGTVREIDKMSGSYRQFFQGVRDACIRKMEQVWKEEEEKGADE